MPLAWQRLPGESAKGWEAARTYFELGGERTQQKAAENLARTWREPGVKGFQKSGARFQLSTWAVKFNWVARAKAFDEYLETERQKTFEKAAAAAGQMWLD